MAKVVTLKALASFAALVVLAAGALLLPVGCGSGSGGSPPSAPGVPFVADSPAVYVAKAKNLLVGLPPTDEEVAAVTRDASALSGLIDGWMTLPEYRDKMLTFFELAFQQTQVSITDFSDQSYPRQTVVNASTRNLIVENAKESFARTMIELAGEGRPFTAALTTRSFMMTPALMELYAFYDAWQVNDDGKVTDRFRKANPTLSLTVEKAEGPIPIEQTLDPSSANYMHWYDPDLGDPRLVAQNCGEDPIAYPARADILHFLLYGSLVRRQNAAGGNCLQFAGSALAPQLRADDFATWKMVTIRKPGPGESPTNFFDLPTLRSTNELVLTLPRVGFFTTPAFFANWQTNTSNQMRVTTNQALIVALGSSVDGTDTTSPPGTPGLDASHASSPDCFACHRTLDPTRSIFSSTYSWNYHDQVDEAFSGQKGVFAFRGVVKNVGSIYDLGDTLASHPMFPAAWVQKLCYYANSGPCRTDDPEFLRIVSVFEKSGYSWNALVREIFASPLVTNAKTTATASAAGTIVAVARRDHVCAALNARFGFVDVCGLAAATTIAAKSVVPEIAAGLPSDGYGRGAVAPVLPNQPTLFYRAGMENICEAVAKVVIDPTATPQAPNAKTWSSADPDSAISDFVSVVMALTSKDPRSAEALSLLKAHFSDAANAGASPADALRSTFVVACLAPSAVSIGM